jgi:hypothetical protein
MESGVVLLRGAIGGPGAQAECDVLAWKAAAPGAHPYARFKVVDAPRHLPDGSYTVSFDGLSFSTRKTEGWWSMEYLAESHEAPVPMPDSAVAPAFAS